MASVTPHQRTQPSQWEGGRCATLRHLIRRFGAITDERCIATCFPSHLIDAQSAGWSLYRSGSATTATTAPDANTASIPSMIHKATPWVPIAVTSEVKR